MTTSRLLLVVAMAAGAAVAQESITLHVDTPNLSCPVRAWSFGATGGTIASVNTGAGAPKSQISNLVTTRQLDECSVKFFEYAMKGTHFNQVTLTQTDASGRIELVKVQLDNVFVSTFQLGGDSANPNPGESVAFSFGRITVTYNGSSKFFWDVMKNAGG